MSSQDRSYDDKRPGEPLRPDDMTEAFKRRDKMREVIECFNEAILEKWNGDKAVVKQKDVIVKIIERTGIPKRDLYDKHYLDVEPIFIEAGWKVEYDKPAYNENYDAYFEFKK